MSAIDPKDLPRITAAAALASGTVAAAVSSIGYTPANRWLAGFASVATPLALALVARERAPWAAAGFAVSAANQLGSWFLNGTAPRAMTTKPVVIPTVYGGSRGLAIELHDALALFQSWQYPPDGLQLHASYETFVQHGARYCDAIRTVLPHVEIWFAATGDEHFGDVQSGAMSVARLLELRTAMVRVARDSGVPVVQWDCEAMWKRGVQGFTGQDAQAMIAAGREAAPGVQQWLTSYYAPTYHADFPWWGFYGVDGYAPQIYFATGGGQAALDLFRRSWLRAQQLGWINANAELACYLQVDQTGQIEDASAIADQFAQANFWWFAAGATQQGKTLVQALATLRGMGYVGGQRIERFQRDKGLSQSGKLDAPTLAAMSLST